MKTSTRLRTAAAQTIYFVKDAVKTRLESAHWSERPQTLAFEITSICDAKCIHCPRQDMDRSMRPMDFNLFRKMIDQAADMRIPEIFPNGYGEILTLRNLEEYLFYIRSKDFNFKISINTNGNLMTEEKAELFLKYKVDLLNICIDGASVETIEKIRVNLDAERIEKNILRLLQMRQSRNLQYPKVRVGMVLLSQNQHEVGDFFEKWTSVADYVGTSGFSNRGGDLDDKFITQVHGMSQLHACSAPFKELNIYVDGKAVICCQDWNEKHVVGDLTNESLQEIWLGKKFTNVRKLHLDKKGTDIKICEKCKFWRRPKRGEKLWY